MVIAQIVHSLFFIFLTYIFYLKYNKGIVKSLYIYVALFAGILLLMYNLFFNGLPIELFFTLLVFSLSTIIINFMRRFSTVIEDNKELAKQEHLRENILAVKDFIFTKFFVFGMCIYQMLLIWVPKIFEQMSE